jgi:serine-type D-Ala-D-Ala endopeptidase (penicillin-binding protein 7)
LQINHRRTRPLRVGYGNSFVFKLGVAAFWAALVFFLPGTVLARSDAAAPASKAKPAVQPAKAPQSAGVELRSVPAKKAGLRQVVAPQSSKSSARAAASREPRKAQALRRAAASTRPSAKSGSASTAKNAAASRSIQGPGLRPGRDKGRLALRSPAQPVKPSFGELYGLRATADDLDLRSSVALVVDQDTNEVLFSKNSSAVLPIASITKLMTALVVTQASLPMDEVLTVDAEDVQATLGNRSRLAAGTQLTRGEMMHLSLMASENRAAHVLGRTYPGGLSRFVQEMNRTARSLGMTRTQLVEPTGLSDSNQSSAEDLTRLVKAAALHPVIRELSTSPEMVVPMGSKSVQFRNTNGLVRNPEWDIGLQKTGYIAAAGRCLVMQAQLAGRKLIMVFLDSTGKYSRLGDAERIRQWILGADGAPVLRQPR